MDIVDLHVHSNVSDGTLSPKELVDYAVTKGLKAFALTDHDSIDGIDEAIKRADEYKERGIEIEVVSGIELSTEYYGRDVHILGLYIDHESEYLQRKIYNFKLNRHKRNVDMAIKCTEHGMPVTVEELEAEFPNSVITRAHFAKFLLNHGYVKSIKEAFDRYLGDRKPCFVSRKKMSPVRAVEIIRKSGGVPVLAHPVLYGFSKEVLENLVCKLQKVGLIGIEAIYSTYELSDERYIRELAKRFSLCITGGSDYHGANKQDIDLAVGRGRLFIPDEILTLLKDKHDEIKNCTSEYNLPKILFTDLDGTLLDDNKKISEYTYNVLDKWTRNGNYIALCSGRDINSVHEVYINLGLDHMNNVFLIGYNGGQIVDAKTNETLYSIGLKIEDVIYIEDLARSMDIHLHTYSDKNIIAHGQSDELTYYQKVIKTPTVFYGKLADGLKKGPCKCLAIELKDKSKIEKFKTLLMPYAREHGISLMFSNDYYLEIIPSTSGKGQSVLKLCELIGEDGLISVGAGDQENDTSLMDTCDIAIAMKNATDELKNKANLVTDEDNNHSGLAIELDKL